MLICFWEEDDEIEDAAAGHVLGRRPVRICQCGDADHRHREQRRHDPHAEADDDFTAKNPDIKVEWVTLEENVLRQRVTTDIATKGGQFDIMTIGTYEAPIWGKQGWLLPLDDLGADYDVDDLLPAIRAGLPVRRQALRRAVLRRELDGHVPQGPVREGRPDDARRADLGVHRRRRPQDHRQGQARSTASACAARPAGARTWPS